MLCILWNVICITNLTFTTYVHQTVANLQHGSAHHRCHRQGVLSVAFIIPSVKHLHTRMNTHYVCASVWLCFCSPTLQQTILRVLWWVPRGLSDSGTCDVPKHIGDLLTSDEHILCTWSWLSKLKSVNVPLKILIWYPCKESGVIVHMIQILIGCEKFIFHYFNCKILTPRVSQKLSVRWHIVNFFEADWILAMCVQLMLRAVFIKKHTCIFWKFCTWLTPDRWFKDIQHWTCWNVPVLPHRLLAIFLRENMSILCLYGFLTYLCFETYL